MSLTAVLTPDCKYIAIGATGATGEAVLSSEIVISSVVGSVLITTAFTFSGIGASHTLSIPLVASSYGVFKVELKQNSILIASTAVVSHCDVDCCLATLTNSLLDCSCECTTCAPSLAKAQKVFLLIKSAEDAALSYDGSSSTYLTDAHNKYKKAVALCNLSCGCGC
tara:strand:+ start:36834 stop:37334 length:501 start_codon:yes stop_codon:yes gene_type:complete